MGYKFRFDISEFPKGFFEDVMKISQRRGIHKKIRNVALMLIKKFRMEEITNLPLSDLVLLVEDMIDVHIKNITGRKSFKKVKEKKVLFLPHCARKYMDHRCKAEFDPELSTYKCNKCSPDCLINKASSLAHKKGYEVFILPGGSCVKKIMKMRKFKAVVGVACFEEIKLAGEFLKDLQIPAQSVPLMKNGCANTYFNLNTLEKVL